MLYKKREEKVPEGEFFSSPKGSLFPFFLPSFRPRRGEKRCFFTVGELKRRETILWKKKTGRKRLLFPFFSFAVGKFFF